MSFHRSSDEKREQIEKLERLEESLKEDNSSNNNYGEEISRTAWKLNRETGIDYQQADMEELVFKYADHFKDLYEEDPSNVLDYIEQFDGDIDIAIDSFEK